MREIFTTRKTASYVAVLAGCSVRTVRKLADQGKIASTRNHCGWRIFDNPEQIALEVQELLGVNPRYADQKDNG